MKDATIDDVIEPLQLQADVAELASTHLTTRFSAILSSRGANAAESYVMGMLVAAVAASRVAFGDGTVRHLFDELLLLELPAQAPVDERRP